MGQFVKENAHLRTDMNKYGEEYDRIFGKKQISGNIQEQSEISGKLQQQAAESSPFMADGKHDRAYIEGFTDAGTRNLAKIQELEKEIKHLEDCLDDYDSDRVPLSEKLEAANQRIKELEADNKFQEEVIISCGGNEIEKIELEKKLATVIEALEYAQRFIDRDSVSDIQLDFLWDHIKEALAQIKGEA